jgi:ribosomal protein S4
MLNKKRIYKPLYKQFIRLKENVQNRKKLIKFKNIKWQRLIQQYKRKLRRYRKYKPQDQTRHTVSKFSGRGTSYRKRFKYSLTVSKRFRLFYGGLSKKLVKKQIRFLLNKKKKLTNFKLLFLQIFESRLDTIIYKSKFTISLRNSKQLILHGKIYLNDRMVTTPSYVTKPGDIISVDPKYYKLIENNLKNIQVWPLPPKHLTINYKTLEILVGNIKYTNLSTNFTYHFNLEQIIANYYRY